MMARRKVLLGILLLTLVAAYWAPEPAQELVAPVARMHEAISLAANADTPIRPRERTEPDTPLGLFASPPVLMPQIAPPPPPPPPQAPPLPFRLLGRYVDQRGTYVLLANEERGFPVRPGDVIDGLYEVKAIEGSAMTMIYLPLRQIQILDIGVPLSLENNS